MAIPVGNTFLGIVGAAVGAIFAFRASKVNSEIKLLTAKINQQYDELIKNGIAIIQVCLKQWIEICDEKNAFDRKTVLIPEEK